MSDKISTEQYLTFDDVLIVPSYSDFVPRDAVTETNLTKQIKINIPIISAAMDTVTETEMAIAMATLGGIGIVHKNNTIEEQSLIVKNVKRYESGVVANPITTSPNSSVKQVKETMRISKVSGLPVIDKSSKLVGIVTSRDVFFAKDEDFVSEVMTKNVITVPKSSSKEVVTSLLHKHKIEKLVIVDKDGKCIGLITKKDVKNSISNPLASKDKLGRLIVGAAVGIDDIKRVESLIENEVDVIVVDTAHGHSKKVIDAIYEIKKNYKIQVIAGNVVTPEAVKMLCDAGVDCVKVGIGPGSICTTRVVAGIGCPQFSAILRCSEEANKYKVPIIADGGVKTSGDIAKAIAAGASSVMLGNLLAGTAESPGETIISEGRTYKSYRGMGSIGAMSRGSADRYFQQDIKKEKLVAEGVEGIIPFRGPLSTVIHQLVGGLKASMGYTGNKTVQEMRKNCKFVRITNSGLKESHPHSIVITNE